MVDNKTEQAKKKAAEVRDKVKEQSAEAERKVKETVKKAENSTIGKHIPTSFDSATFRDIIKCTLFLNSIITIGFYCIVSAATEDVQNTLRKTLITLSYYIILVFGLGGILIDTIFFFGHLFPFFQVFLAVKFIKLIGCILFIFSGHRSSWLQFFSVYLYAACCICLDLFFIYYLAIYEERCTSDDYDENGMLKEDRKVEEP